MDIEEEFKKFVSSDRPLRQTREEVGLMITIGLTEGRACQPCPAQVRNLSRGGVGVCIPAERAEFADLLAPGCEASLEIHWPDEPDALAAKAQLVWIGRGQGGRYLAGFQFTGLCPQAQEQVDRCLLSQIIRRHIEDGTDA